MLCHGLEPLPVSDDPACLTGFSVADDTSNHTLMYTPEGKQTTERLWEETLEELRFANVRDILSRAQSTK